MATYTLNGELIGPGRPFTHDGLQYQGNWTELATPEEIAAIGMVEYVPPAVEPPPPWVPPSVSPRQIRMALTRIDMRLAVETAVAAGDQDLKDWWEFSTSVDRNNMQVEAMATALGLSTQQLDDLWTLAYSL